MTDQPSQSRHIGRAWSGHDIEDDCPCPQEPCGLVDQDRTHPDCDQHPWRRGKTIRQGHRADACPGPEPQRQTTPSTPSPRPPTPDPRTTRATALGMAARVHEGTGTSPHRVIADAQVLASWLATGRAPEPPA